VGYVHDQRQSAVRLEWGQLGAAAICRGASYAVIVDVLSFTTTLSVAVDAGAEVFPYPWQDGSAQSFARQHSAILAVGRAESGSPVPADSPGADTPASGALGAGRSGASEAAAAASSSEPGTGDPPRISLSPATIRAIPGLARIVLPSPNGSALASQLADSGATVIGGCLRNRTAIAKWLVSHQTRDGITPVIAVIAAGERWPDGSLRPAIEDLWGAGAIVSALGKLGTTGLSPEATSAAAAYRAIEATLAQALVSCSSGIELASAGFGGDVAVAAELDSSTCVPVLAGGRFIDASRGDQADASRGDQTGAS
jgi:2-phosphosulfolactate phosphatase